MIAKATAIAQTTKMALVSCPGKYAFAVKMAAKTTAKKPPTLITKLAKVGRCFISITFLAVVIESYVFVIWN